MKKYIHPESIIISDSAPQYRGCENLGFSDHRAVNHSRIGEGRFVDPNDSQTHTQNIEIRNRYVKDTIKSLRTDRVLQQYICEYTYRNRILSSYTYNWEKFVRFVTYVNEVYPGPGRQGLILKKSESMRTRTQESHFLILPFKMQIPIANKSRVRTRKYNEWLVITIPDLLRFVLRSKIYYIYSICKKLLF